MILNIEGTNSPFTIQRFFLEPFCGYSIRLIALHALIASSVSAGVYKVCTNMIDREIGNSNRSFCYVRLDRKAHVIDITPTQPVWYKLRWLDTVMADIHLQSITTDEKLVFSQFACQVEIVKNERV